MSSGDPHPPAEPETPGSLDILSRAGGNDRVLGKKVLLAALAAAEAERRGLGPSVAEVDALAGVMRRELALQDDAVFADWLAEAGLDASELRQVLTDFAAVLAVESAMRGSLAARLSRHRRLVRARERRLARLKGTT